MDFDAALGFLGGKSFQCGSSALGVTEAASHYM